ncbi:DUF1540 domain-containing protein [Pseudonocardia sp. DLS-67]
MNPVQDRPSTCNCSHAEAPSHHGDHAHCCTFVELSLRAGADPTALLGACHRSDCRFDDMLGCPASPMNAGARGDPTAAGR